VVEDEVEEVEEIEVYETEEVSDNDVRQEPQASAPVLEPWEQDLTETDSVL
jgi:hypothetical protein